MLVFSTIAIALQPSSRCVMLWGLYCPTARVSVEALPTLTVVIPAFNEGPMVTRSITSVLAAATHQSASSSSSSMTARPMTQRATSKGGTRQRAGAGHHPGRKTGKRSALYAALSPRMRQAPSSSRPSTRTHRCPPRLSSSARS